MWSEMALQFLGVVANPAIVLLPALLLLVTRRRLWIVAATALAALGFGLMEALGSDLAHGAMVLLVSALAGAVAAEIVLAIVLPCLMMALSGMLWVRARRRPPSDPRG